MDVSHILDNLNSAQREAVTAPLSPMLVLAGAGSGKTRVLVHRIAWLMTMESMSPHSVLAVTFTNKAAREMRGRIEALLGSASRGMWFGTFHSLAHRLLRAHWRDADLPENFQIIDSDDQLRLIKRIMKELQIDESKWPPRQAQGFINSAKDDGRRAGQVHDAKGGKGGHDLYLKAMTAIYQAYEAYCNRSGLLDFGELLLRSHELWLRNPELLRHYQSRFKVILVDEFQDTNTIQYAWLRVLAGQEVPLTVVGDDDQSIYGWRGARIENIQQFQQDFANSRLVRLEQNYRSTRTILDASNALIAGNSGRLGKQLWTEGEDGEPIDVYAAFNEQDEANYLAERMQGWVESGGLRQDIAVLYRSNAQSRVIEESLLRHNVPYRIYGGLRFYDRAEIKNALAYLRLVHFAHDDAALERVVNVPARGVGAITLENIREHARQNAISLWQAIEQLVESKGVSARARKSLAEFMGIIYRLTELKSEISLSELVKQMLDESGLLDFHGAEKNDKAQARVENLEELINATKDYEPEENLTPLAAFIAQAALDAGENQAGEHEDCVQLMTLHSAKGLEFPLVFLVGLEEGLFPHSLSVEEPGRMEEERRLCYVGMTRAMKKLVLTYAESRRLYGQDQFNSVSRFIREVPVAFLQEIRIGSCLSSASDFQQSSPLAQNDTGGFSLGQRVRHQKFGEGVVISCEGQGPHSRIQVNFSEGSKWLVLSYAKLEVI